LKAGSFDPGIKNKDREDRPMMKGEDLKGRVAIVTGAAQGIGRACARFLCEHGATCVIADVSFAAAKKTAEDFSEEGLAAYAVRLDVSDPASVKECVAEVVSRFSRVDILVNNAGVKNSYDAVTLPPEEWDRVIDVDLKGTHLCSQACMKIMMEQRFGRIVNIASMAGEVGGLKVGPDYSAAKAGAICLAKSYARYGAKYNVTANSVCPGFIETEMTQGRDNPGEVPIGRLGTPLDIAKAVYFLCSDLADYITGANIDVNGGLQMLG
jgi:3-oxoacyl-[acyl-carrier protein] reductase